VTNTPGRRAIWEQRWDEGTESGFAWHMTEVPADLPELLDHHQLSAGAALDLGCGGGVATAYLAGRVATAVGLDIAYGAVAEARRLARETAAAAHFVVADATALPFRPGAFALVFDRGCLQNLPQPAWPGYFPAIEAVLQPGGHLQLYCSKAAGPASPPWSWRGLRARLAWLRGRRGPGPQFLSRQLIGRLAQEHVQVLTLEDRDFRTAKGNRRALVYGLFATSGKARSAS